MLPKLQLPISDVRDVATAHIKCLTLQGVPGMCVNIILKKSYMQCIAKSVRQ